MIPLQIHYGGGDSWCAQGSFGVALDEEGSGVGATAEEHRWQNHRWQNPVCTGVSLSAVRSRTRQALTMGVAGQWCPPALCMVGNKSCTMCGREGRKQEPSKSSVLAVCWGCPVWAELPSASLLRMEPQEGGQRCWMQRSSLVLVPHPDLVPSPQFAGQRSLCKSYSAISGKICFSLILPGSAWLAGLISLK